MAVSTSHTRPTSATSPVAESRSGLRLSPGTYQRRPWQIGIAVALVVVCAIGAVVLLHSSSQRVSVVTAAKDLPAGTVLTAGDLSTSSIPTTGHINAMAAAGSSVLIGQQLDTQVFAGEVMVKEMISVAPQLASGDQVVGMLEKGDQMPSVPLVAGDTVEVVAVPEAGQGSTIGGTIGTVLVPSATVFAVGPAPANQSQYQASISLEVPSADAATVTAFAAADQVGLSLVAEGAK